MNEADDFDSLFTERVHVAFLGWEIERIVKPVIKMNGNRLIMISFPKKREKAWKYYEGIKEQLTSKGIRVELIETSLYDMTSLLSILNKIVQIEHARGNEIYINVSAGTKITVCASVIAAMANKKVTAYYVQTNTYYPREHFEYPQTLTSGVSKVTALPECQINIPESKYIETLAVIHNREKEHGQKVYLKDLINELKRRKLISVKKNRDSRKQASSEYMAALNLTKKCMNWGYIEISKKRKNKFVTLTRKGRNAIEMYYNYKIDKNTLKNNEDLEINEWIKILKY
ncbi:MAG: HFX_2341 family transcriptional regulator domain-containing protein [Promethearchaeota archaeon]